MVSMKRQDTLLCVWIFRLSLFTSPDVLHTTFENLAGKTFDLFLTFCRKLGWDFIPFFGDLCSNCPVESDIRSVIERMFAMIFFYCSRKLWCQI